MPEVWGLSAEEAQRVLMDLGLTFEVRQMTSTSVPVGGIISVAPRPGSPLEADTRIILALSTGPPTVAPGSDRNVGPNDGQ